MGPMPVSGGFRFFGQRGFRGDAAEGQGVRDAVAAKAVGAVQAAGGFARGIQAGDDFAVGEITCAQLSIFRPPIV